MLHKVKTQIKSKTLLIIPLLSLVTIFSCVSKKDILYMQDIEEKLSAQSSSLTHEPTIGFNDLLFITVSTYDLTAAEPFNLMIPARNAEIKIPAGNMELQGYLVSAEGTIEFPVIGTLKVGGLTRLELIEMLKTEVSKYIKNPIINVKISNYKVTVLGEVNLPGTFTVPDERITLLEALGYAGDLTIYGKRDNILVIREIDGVKTHHFIDITKADFLHSPFYFLLQNDVVYIQPNSAKVNSAAYSTNASVYISVASVLISLVILLTR